MTLASVNVSLKHTLMSTYSVTSYEARVVESNSITLFSHDSSPADGNFVGAKVTTSGTGAASNSS